MQELIGTGTKWQAGAILVASAIAGFSLAISMVSSPKMNLFYVDSSTSNLFVTSYSSGWTTPVALSTSKLGAWNGTSTGLAAIAETSPDYLRTYYIGSDLGVYEMLDVLGSSWSNQSDQSTEWPSSDTSSAGAVAGIGWGDQVRLYYRSGQKIVQADLNNQTWTESTALGTGS